MSDFLKSGVKRFFPGTLGGRAAALMMSAALFAGAMHDANAAGFGDFVDKTLNGGHVYVSKQIALGELVDRLKDGAPSIREAVEEGVMAVTASQGGGSLHEAISVRKPGGGLQEVASVSEKGAASEIGKTCAADHFPLVKSKNVNKLLDDFVGKLEGISESRQIRGIVENAPRLSLVSECDGLGVRDAANIAYDMVGAVDGAHVKLMGDLKRIRTEVAKLRPGEHLILTVLDNGNFVVGSPEKIGGKATGLAPGESPDTGRSMLHAAQEISHGMLNPRSIAVVTRNDDGGVPRYTVTGETALQFSLVAEIGLEKKFGKDFSFNDEVAMRQ